MRQERLKGPATLGSALSAFSRSAVAGMAAGSGRELRARRGLAAPGRAAVPAQRGPQLLPSAPSRVPNTGDPRGSVNQRCDGREVHKRICREIAQEVRSQEWQAIQVAAGDHQAPGMHRTSTAPFQPSRPGRLGEAVEATRGKRRKLIIVVTAGALAVVAGIAAVIVTVVRPAGTRTPRVLCPREARPHKMPSRSPPRSCRHGRPVTSGRPPATPITLPPLRRHWPHTASTSTSRS